MFPLTVCLRKLCLQIFLIRSCQRDFRFISIPLKQLCALFPHSYRLYPFHIPQNPHLILIFLRDLAQNCHSGLLLFIHVFSANSQSIQAKKYHTPEQTDDDCIFSPYNFSRITEYFFSIHKTVPVFFCESSPEELFRQCPNRQLRLHRSETGDRF